MNLALAAARRYAMMVGMAVLPFSALRVLVMRACGVQVGRGCYVGFNVAFDTNYPHLIRIGSHVTISHNVAIYTHTATPARSPLSEVYDRVAAVSIGDGAWIAAHSVVLPGVDIAADCMIGAGSVVTRNTTAGALYAGCPARLIKRITLPLESARP